MATVTGLTLVKTFTYRGNANEQFSNTYHFTSAPPTSDGQWLSVANQIVAIEQLVFPASVSFHSATGHSTDNPHDPATFSHDYTLTPPAPVGTYVPSASEFPIAGDQAAFVWWLMNYKSTKGKPVYLRKYLHAGYVENLPHPDNVGTKYAAALETYGNQMQSIWGGLRSVSKPGGVSAHGHGTFITTRTLKRRGKKKKTP